MTTRQEAEEALHAGQNAAIGDPNPYVSKSLALAQLWARGYETMLTIRTATGPARQAFLSGDAGSG